MESDLRRWMRLVEGMPPEPDVRHVRIERVKPTSFGSKSTGATDYLYHITHASKATLIQQQGFILTAPPTIARFAYAEHSKGKIFFCPRDSVRYWIMIVCKGLEPQTKYLPDVGVLRVRRAEIADLLHSDPHGSTDSKKLAFYVESPLLPT